MRYCDSSVCVTYCLRIQYVIHHRESKSEYYCIYCHCSLLIKKLLAESLNQYSAVVLSCSYNMHGFTLKLLPTLMLVLVNIVSSHPVGF